MFYPDFSLQFLATNLNLLFFIVLALWYEGGYFLTKHVSLIPKNKIPYIESIKFAIILVCILFLRGPEAGVHLFPVLMKEQPYVYQFYIMMGLSLVLIYMVGTMRPQPMSSVIDKEKFWADKVHAKTKYNVIVAGDSRVYRGIASRVISEELDGLKVLNFGFSSGGLNTEIFNEIKSGCQRR